MSIRLYPAFAAALALVCACSTPRAAFAHAQLQSASPPVGGAVSPPGEIRLTFSEGLEPKFCGVTVVCASGAAEPVSRPSVSPGDNKVLVVKARQGARAGNLHHQMARHFGGHAPRAG